MHRQGIKVFGPAVWWAVVLILFSGLARAAAGSDRVVTLAAVGDVVLGTDFPVPKLPPDDGRGLLAEVKDLFAQADMVFGNLEGPLVDGGVCAKPVDRPNVFAFRTPTRFARTLKEAHFSVMSLANNHTQDFGALGLASTKRVLTQEGIKFSSKDGEVAEFQIKGVRVGVIALTYGPPPRSIVFPAEALREIETLARKYDVLVVSIHGGAEGGGAQNVRNQTEFFLGENRGNLVKFSRDAIDRGADLIIGHGPHVPRALEVYKGRLIAYSLGNFCTYKTMNLAGAGGYAPVLWAELDGRGEFLRGKVHSFLQLPPGGVKKDPQEQAFRLMRALSQVDFPESAPQFAGGGAILPGQRR